MNEMNMAEVLSRIADTFERIADIFDDCVEEGYLFVRNGADVEDDEGKKYAKLKDAISDIKTEIREQKSRYTDKEVLEIIDRYLNVIGEKVGEVE